MYAVVGVVVIIVVVVVALFLGGYFGGTTGTPVSINDDGTCATNATSCNFNPANVTITHGGTVTWTNKGTAANGHTVTNDPGYTSSMSFDKSLSSNGATASIQFSTAGTYHYYCSIHAWMKGTVVVS